MIDTATARAKILASIRDASRAGMQPHDVYAAMPRRYVRAKSLDDAARMALFVERLHEYEAGVHFTTEATIADSIAGILASRNKVRMLLPDGLPETWLPVSMPFIYGNDLAPRELDSYDGVLTACTVAIALTGTIVLQNAPGQGPRALSLVPDYHLCVVFAAQIVETVPEAFDLLKPTERLPTTFVSGPSATADIEMTRIKGVHGPRFLDVLVVN